MHAHEKPTTLVQALALGMKGGIERQEKAGQVEMCNTEVLPKECPRAELEAVGVRFGDDHDDLFVDVTLPAGWKKQATDHSMYSDLVDDKGRKRASIFYKAAFYDRRADLYLVRRYSVDNHLPCDAQGNTAEYGKHTHVRTVVKDGDAILESFEIRSKEYSRENYDLAEQHRKDACAWLTERFPQWEDTTAYWD
jgi:hypothetical protein